MVSFALGAVIPLVPYLAGAQSLVISVLAPAGALLVGAAIVGRVTSRPLVRSGLRQPALGAAAAAVTYEDRSGDRGVNSMTGMADRPVAASRSGRDQWP